MDRMSFSADAGHLMERLLLAGALDAGGGVVVLQPEADTAAMDLLREAAEGGWIVELLDAEDEPDSDGGDVIRLAKASSEEICGYTVDADGNMDGGFLRLALPKIDKIHVY